MLSARKIQSEQNQPYLYKEIKIITECQKKIHETKFLGLKARVNGLATAVVISRDKLSAERVNPFKKAALKINSLQDQITFKLHSALRHLDHLNDRAFAKLNNINQTSSESVFNQVNCINIHAVNQFKQIQTQLTSKLKSEYSEISEFLDIKNTEDLDKIFLSLQVYETIILGSLFFCSNNQTNGIQIFQIIQLLNDRYANKKLTEDEKENILEMIKDFQRVGDRLNESSQNFKNIAIQGTPITNLINSANQKFIHLCKQLEAGNLEHANLSFQIAMRHNLKETIDRAVAESQQITKDLITLENYAQLILKGLDKSRSEKIAQELTAKIQSTQEEITPSIQHEQALRAKKKSPSLSTKRIKHSAKIEPSTTTKPVTLAKSKPAKTEKNDVDLVEIRSGLHNKTQWLKSDLQRIQNNTQSPEKKELAYNLETPLNLIEERLENDYWPKSNDDIHARKQHIEQELLDLEQLLEQISLAKSRPATPETSTHETTSSTNDLLLQSIEKTQQSTAKNDLVAKPKPIASAHLTASVVNTNRPINSLSKEPISTSIKLDSSRSTSSAPVFLHPFEFVLQDTTEQLNFLLHRLNSFNMQKHQTQANLLHSQAALSPIWANIYQSQAILNYLQMAIIECPHQLFIVPYQETIAPASEMLRLIQLQKNHPHFNMTNVKYFLNHIQAWVLGFEDKFQQLDYLLNYDPRLTTG